MSDYDSGYDPKYGYNRNAFAHQTPGTAVMGRVVKLIVTPIGLVSEAVHARKDKRRPSSDAAAKEAGSKPSAREDTSCNRKAISTEGQTARKDSAYVDVPPEVADELIASGQVEPTDGQAPTHELVLDDKDDDGMDHDEADWALDEAAAEGEDKEPASTKEEDSENSKGRASATGNLASKKPMQKLPFPVILPNVAPVPKPVVSYVPTHPFSKKLVSLKKHSYASLKNFTKLPKRPQSLTLL